MRGVGQMLRKTAGPARGPPDTRCLVEGVQPVAGGLEWSGDLLGAEGEGPGSLRLGPQGGKKGCWDWGWKGPGLAGGGWAAVFLQPNLCPSAPGPPMIARGSASSSRDIRCSTAGLHQGLLPGRPAALGL